MCIEDKGIIQPRAQFTEIAKILFLFGRPVSRY